MMNLSPPEAQMPPDDEKQSGYQHYLLTKSIFSDVRRLSLYFALTLFLEAGILLLFEPFATLLVVLLDVCGLYENVGVVDIVSELYTFTVYLCAFLPPYLLYAKITGYRLQQIPRDRPYWPVLLSTMGVTMGVSLVGGLLSTLALGFFSSIGMNPPDLDFEYPHGAFALLLNLLNATLLPAVVEELTYRGILLGTLRKYGDKCAIFLSALFFGLAHGNMAQFPHAFLLGLALAYFVIKTNSIYTGIFIHFVNNLLVTVLDLISLDMNDMQYALLNFGDFIFYIVCFVVGIIYFCGLRHVDWKLHPSGCPVAERTITKKFLCTFPLILAQLMLVWKILASFT